MKKIFFSFAAFALVAASFISFSFSNFSTAQATDMNYWNNGQIITDGNFWTSGKMSKADIQTFLNSKNPNCVSSGNNKCLKNYTETTSTRNADTYCAKYTGASNESAAQIISKVSAACKISEKVILVMLQKEQGLVTALWAYYVDPNRNHSNDDSHYKSAMGMGCPDTAACDSKYYGFANQVYSAARQLNLYRATGNYNYKPDKDNYVRYSPNSSCGGTTFYISNWATAALYTYTPYQPNSAALKNPNGTGDNCSAYGNRNFFVYYTDWFGRPNSYYIHGAIANTYNSNGGSGKMGGATSYEALDVNGAYQNFAHARIFWWKNGKGTYPVWWSILDRYKEVGGQLSQLKYPTSGELTFAKGAAQTFQGGNIYWNK
ncbi:MAG: hypothetical protein LBB10_02615, partial [Bifidobacteriaceae bacterium]|nr:hypothetical protein [Bifidobacteriaceae bacterium]